MKSPPPLPGFICRASDELMDEGFHTLNLAERGLVHSLRLLCWCNGSAPADPAVQATLLGVKRADINGAFTKRVKEMFKLDGDRLISPELELERVEAAQRRRIFSVAGKKGAEVRYGSHATGQANGQAIAERKEGTEVTNKGTEARINSENNVTTQDNANEYIQKMLEGIASNKRMN